LPGINSLPDQPEERTVDHRCLEGLDEVIYKTPAPLVKEAKIRFQAGPDGRDTGIAKEHPVSEREAAVDRVRIWPRHPPPELQVGGYRPGIDLVIHIGHEPMDTPDLIDPDQEFQLRETLVDNGHLPFVQDTFGALLLEMLDLLYPVYQRCPRNLQCI